MGDSTTPPGVQRLVSLDAYRGFVMLAMASGGLGLKAVADRSFEENLWDTLAAQVDHVAWRGCSPWDLIQPSFMFIVGVAMPFSDAARAAARQPWGRRLRHAVVRSFILVALGIFLSSNGRPFTNWTFVNVLTQIGLGYTFVFLLLGRPWQVQLSLALLILVGYWAWFATGPLPPRQFDPTRLGGRTEWVFLPGFEAHWEFNTNSAAVFDRRFLNLFPRTEPFRFNEGGYATLNFVPSIATMVFGVLAGEWLRSDRRGSRKVAGLFVAGALCMGLGRWLDYEGVCPIVKRIWTPSWAIYATSWTCWLLAVFYGFVDLLGYRRAVLPLTVVGMNSIAMYVMAQLMKPFVRSSLKTHLGTFVLGLNEHGGTRLDPRVFVGPYGPIYESAAVLIVLWAVCWWLYHRRIFFRI